MTTPKDYIDELQAAIVEAQKSEREILELMQELNPGLDHEKLSVIKIQSILVRINHIQSLHTLSLLKVAQAINAMEAKKAGVNLGALTGKKK